MGQTAPVSPIDPANQSFFGPSALDPYFSGLLGRDASKALAEDRLVEAVRIYDKIAVQVSDIEITPRARFMAAYLAGRLGNHDRALKELPGLAEELPLLANLAREQAAFAAFKLGEHGRAIHLASLVDDTSTVAADALLLRADAQRAMGNLEEALENYKQYLERWPSGHRRLEVQSRLVDCLAERVTCGHTEMAVEALEHLDRLKAQAPASRWTKAVAKHEQRLLRAANKKTPRTRNETRVALAVYEKATKLMAKMRNSEAERAFVRVNRLARVNGELSCRARYNQAVVISRQREHERAALKFDVVVEDCRQPDIRVRALYRGGKSYFAAGRYQDAIRLFGDVETDFGAHSFADDARLHAARCHLELGDRNTFVEKLEELPKIYPAGDMRAEAFWILAKDMIAKNDLVEARNVLSQYYAQFPRESGWYAAGRSGYWLGRVEELLGNTENAAMRYEQVVAGFPLTFYMVLSYNRLASLRAERVKELVGVLNANGAGKEILFPMSLLKDFPSLATGIELHRLGLSKQALREFNGLLFEPDLPPEIYWLTAAIMRDAGQFHTAGQFAAHAGKSWRQRYPAGYDFSYWNIAYPVAYEDQVVQAASESDVPPELVWAVMREESGFDPKVESWANAIGLMQLILPTARRVGRDLGIKVNRRTLRRPSVNIALGSAYLGHLKGKFKGHPALMIAGYNAGEGAVQRWLKERPGAELDMFVEDIPYSQTRGYTKRVIATLATYLYLYGDGQHILELDLTLSR
ncbi:MAG: transglycosylase SLT domain-containing protein [Proteobacteria bacterium]|nr:transglycosylase SLT domain-containing protein [Pseudomonadota bacterium]